MKKSLLAIAALAIALTASAATTMETSTRSYTPTNAKVNVNSLRSNSLFAKKAKKVRAKVSVPATWQEPISRPTSPWRASILQALPQ